METEEHLPQALGRVTDDPTLSAAATPAATYMKLAREFAQLRSKDPNTKVGACAHDPKTGGLYLGYNGFNEGMPDLEALWRAREIPTFLAYTSGYTLAPSGIQATKYEFVVHAEANAIRKAMMGVGTLERCTLYVTHYPCHRCMKDFIIPSGIRQVVFASLAHFDPISDYLAKMIGVQMTLFNPEPSTPPLH